MASSNKTVTFLISNLSQGGLSKYCLKLAEAFCRKDCLTRILTMGYSLNDRDTHPIEIINLGKRYSLTLLHLWNFDIRCTQWLKENPSEIVFGFDRNFCAQTHYRAGNGVHAAYLDYRSKKEGFLKKLSFAANPMHTMILRMEKATFESPKLKSLFVNSRLVRDQVAHYYPRADLNKVRVVHNGVEWKQLQPAFEESLLRQEDIQAQLGLNSLKYQFLFVGHEYSRKGLEVLLRALSKLTSTIPWQLSVLGRDKHLAFFKQLSRQLGIEKNVIFFGPRSDVIQFYQACDALVVPSLYDPFANVTVEALAMGLRVISSSTNGGSEVITPKTGWIFQDPLSDVELSQVLEQAVRAPKTNESAELIRRSVQHLEFENQLNCIVDTTLS